MTVLIAPLLRLIAPLIRLIASRRRSGGSVSACMRPSQVMGRYQKQCHGRSGCKRTHLMREAIRAAIGMHSGQ